MKIMANRMDRGFFRYQKEFEEKALEVLRSGWYVLGNEVKVAYKNGRGSLTVHFYSDQQLTDFANLLGAYQKEQ